MHLYFSSIGFSKVRTEAELEKLLDEVFRDYQKRATAKLENGGVFLEMSKDFVSGMGICLCGILDENGFHQKYYFPYYRSNGTSTLEEVTVERRADGETFAGVCDDGRMGVSMIFFVQNPSAYFKGGPIDFVKERKAGTAFTCLAQSGKILLPVMKKEVREEERILDISQRSGLVNAARNGDQNAIEDLTVEDMDMYSMISKRVVNEDILSIVDTSFMPYGIECDRYQMIGTINYFTKVCNPYTGEFVYQMNVECNDMYFDVCINANDLLGEPDEGRRFKGVVWLQGRIGEEEDLPFT